MVRRLDYPVFESPKFGSPRKSYPPGQHGSSMRRRVSTFGLQLREKQRIKQLYGVLERQFRKSFQTASDHPGPTGANLMVMLESRLDNTVYRLGFASTRRGARQLVSHRHLLVNGTAVNIPSYVLKAGDLIQVRTKSRKLEAIHNAMRRISEDTQMPWLALDKAKLAGTFVSTPQRDEIPEPVNEQLVVELFSK